MTVNPDGSLVLMPARLPPDSRARAEVLRLVPALAVNAVLLIAPMVLLPVARAGSEARLTGWVSARSALPCSSVSSEARVVWVATPAIVPRLAVTVPSTVSDPPPSCTVSVGAVTISTCTSAPETAPASAEVSASMVVSSASSPSVLASIAARVPSVAGLICAPLVFSSLLVTRYALSSLVPTPSALINTVAPVASLAGKLAIYRIPRVTELSALEKSKLMLKTAAIPPFTISTPGISNKTAIAPEGFPAPAKTGLVVPTTV